MEKDVITIKGDRDKWIDFISVVKKNKKQVWDILSPMIEKYIDKNS